MIQPLLNIIHIELEIMIELINKNIKNQIFSGHETFPLRYGWLKKGVDVLAEAEKKSFDAKDVFGDESAIAKFGVGKNMVSSIRHWCNLTGLIQNNTLTERAKKIFLEDGLDPYMENPLTLWIFHYQLVTNPQLVTYYWYFNINNNINLDRKTFQSEILDYCAKQNYKMPAITTLKRDIECFLRLYMPKIASHSDDSIESPLAELELIVPLQKTGYFAPNRGIKYSFDLSLFWLAIFMFWKENAINQKTLSLVSLTYQSTSPGRVFLLDENAIISLIYDSVNQFEGKVEWSETAGLKQLELRSGADLHKLILDCQLKVEKAFKNEI